MRYACKSVFPSPLNNLGFRDSSGGVGLFIEWRFHSLLHLVVTKWRLFVVNLPIWEVLETHK